MSQSEIKHSLGRRLLLAAASLALAAFSAGAVHAAPPDVIVCTYFNDASMSQVVGVCVEGCTSINCSGTQTSFVHCADTGRSCQQPVNQVKRSPAGTRPFTPFGGASLLPLLPAVRSAQ